MAAWIRWALARKRGISPISRPERDLPPPLDAALAELPPDSAEAVRLWVDAELRYAGVARRLGCTGDWIDSTWRMRRTSDVGAGPAGHLPLLALNGPSCRYDDRIAPTQFALNGSVPGTRFTFENELFACM